MTGPTRVEASEVLEELTLDGEGSGLEVEKIDVMSAPFDPARIDVVTQARPIDVSPELCTQPAPRAMTPPGWWLPVSD